MNIKNKKIYVYATTACLLAFASMTYYCLFSSFSKKDYTSYIYIDNDDNIDSVYHKLDTVATGHGLTCFRTMVRHSQYSNNIRTGRYAIHAGDGTLKVFRHLKNGMQEPVNLTIPSVRTKDRLAAEISKRMMIDSTALLKALNDEAVCEK